MLHGWGLAEVFKNTLYILRIYVHKFETVICKGFFQKAIIQFDMRVKEINIFCFNLLFFIS
jgi:hypothetical protein